MTPLKDEFLEVLEPLGRSFEIIFVDDCSEDDTVAKVREIAGSDTRIRLVRHRENFGQSAAFLTGFEHARGLVFITMDGDMQNDPHDIPRMLESLYSCDMVCGIRTKRRDTIVKKISSKIANRFRDYFLKDGIRDAGCSFRVFRRSVVTQLVAFKGFHRFFPTICVIHGFRVEQVPVNHRPRHEGKSKYGIGNRLFVGIHDMIGIAWYRRRHIPPMRKK